MDVFSHCKKQVFLMLFCLSMTVAAYPFESDADSDSEQIFVTPTRLKQSPHATPASVTKIRSDTIRALQIRTIPELFRYVAGMVSAYPAANQPRISYHGTNGSLPRRMQVLINGISEYRPSEAEINWVGFPISVEDIDYVEITRSPSAATYGSNSMMAVINIKTKRPDDTVVGGKVKAGSRDAETETVYSSGSLAGGAQYRVSAESGRDNGYDRNAAGADRRDGVFGKHVNSVVTFSGDRIRGDAFLAARHVLSELETRDSGQTTFPDAESDLVQVASDVTYTLTETNELKLKVYATELEQDMTWRTCYPTIMFSDNLRRLNAQNPGYAATLLAGRYPAGGTPADNALRDASLAEYRRMGAAALAPTCGWVNESGRERKYDLQLEDTVIVSDNLRFVSGAEFLREYLDHETFVNGKVADNTYLLFGNAEYRLAGFVFNAGGLVEDENDLHSPVLSPRFGANYRLSDAKTLRFVFSKAIRTPDIMENERDWNYYMRDMTPVYPIDGRTEGYFYFNARQANPLESEEVIAREVSLYSQDTTAFGAGSLAKSYDIKLFHDSLTNLVSEKTQFLDYHLTNNGAVYLQGVELESDATLTGYLLPDYLESVRAHASYAYIDNDANNPYERKLDAQHSGSMYAIANIRNGYLATISYFGNSAIHLETTDVFELGGGRRFETGGGELSLLGKVVYEPDRETTFNKGSLIGANTVGASSITSINRKSASYYLTAEYALQ